MIGGSYIGAEVAASLTEMGKRCTILMLEDVTLSGVFGEQAGRYFHDLLESKGVEVIGGEEVEAFLGEDRVAGVRTKSGREIDCDAVIVGAGVKPDVMLAERAGLEVDGGIVCDAGLETSAEGIFAAGDCARWDSARHGPACVSNTGTSPSSRAGTRPAGCSATSGPTRSFPISSVTSPTGPRSST